MRGIGDWKRSRCVVSTQVFEKWLTFELVICVFDA